MKTFQIEGEIRCGLLTGLTLSGMTVQSGSPASCGNMSASVPFPPSPVASEQSQRNDQAKLGAANPMNRKNRQSSHKTIINLGEANGTSEQLSGSGVTPPPSIDNLDPQMKDRKTSFHRKMSLRAEDLLSCNDQLLMPNPPGNSLGFNPNQKEIGPALTPLIDEVDQDQGLLEGEINQLIQTSKSLAGSLSSPDPNHTDQDVEEPQTVDRSILKQQHHHPTENAPGSSMMISGILIFISSSLLWIIGIPLILFDLDSFGDTINDANDYVDPTKSSVSGWLKWLLIKILDDQHYKYFLPLQITFGLVFVIINWGGLKIFRHS